MKNFLSQSLHRKIFVPGVYLIFMVYGLLGLFFLIDYSFEGIGRHNFHEFNAYFLAFIITLLMTIIFQIFSFRKWDQQRLWVKFLMLISAYTANFFVFFLWIGFLSAFGVKFEDAEGHVFLIFFFSILLYFVIGGLIVAVHESIMGVGKKLKGP